MHNCVSDSTEKENREEDGRRKKEEGEKKIR
jgi:hypothetical protein